MIAWRRGRFREAEDTLRVPDFILKSSAFVVSIAKQSAHGPIEEYDFEGSGFFVGVPFASCNNQRSCFYFVTAAHTLRNAVLNDAVPSETTRYYGIRLNLTHGGTVVIPVDRWYTHPFDPNADVAIASFENKYKQYEVQFLSQAVFLPKDLMTKYEVGIGDEVYFPGLFTLTQEESDRRNLPILRMGNIVMLPEVKVPSELGLIEAYLVEARSIGGISGSPVFSRRTMSVLWNDGAAGEPARTLHGMTGEIHLIGMMHGHWDVKESELNQARIQPLGLGNRAQGVNLGIALVIPINKISETLQHPDLVRLRDEQEQVLLTVHRMGTSD